MDTETIAPATEVGLDALREAGISGAPEWEALGLAESILDDEREASGLAEANLDDAARQWWGDASETLMASYREGLRERARAAIRQCILDVRTPVNAFDDTPVDHLPLRDIEFDEDWAEQFIEVAAEAADLPPEDIVTIVAEFCPIRDADHAAIYAGFELQTYHRAPARRRNPLPDCEPEELHREFLKSHDDALRHKGAKFAPWYLALVEQSRKFFVDSEPQSKTGAPTNEELTNWVGRLEGVDGAHQARSALFQLQNGMVRGGESNPQPVDLWQRHEAPELPLGVLPPLIEQFALGQAEIMGADAAGLAMSALAVCAGAITDDIAIQVKRHDTGWRESARLWVGLVGMPSTKKTPIMNAAMKPLRRIDAALAQRNEEAMRRYKALPKAEQASAPEPKQPRHVVEDATIESLQQVLTDSPYGLLAIHDELSGWFGSMDKYNPGKGSAADRAFWLKSFNGGPYSVNRVMRGSTLIPNLSIGLLGGIQPEPLRKIAGESVDDGLIQRFLPIVLRPATMGRDVPTGDAVAIYERLVERLTKLAPPRSGNLSTGEPLAFSAAAREVRERLEVEHVSLVRALETVSPKLAAHFGKLDGIFARLCLLWHCIEHANESLPREISGNVAERVARFVAEFLRPNAVAFYAGMLGMSAGHEDLMALAAFIVSEALGEISARDVQRSTRALRHVTADDARRLCEKLEAFGWLYPMASNGKGSTTRWRVVPEVHMMFAERGRQESERRAAARAAIAEALRP